ncbi:hypothetical protein ANCDUO_13966 [Ancylostoma duodenale]|uniref:Uncharacterized protein n=1 Tax=Ancylostoma duodenale TaxID=51022 RepID=A0A0C2D1K0_9BILA|nr:hypothetical protein ANCDUO_13966 [Ancylostoma duodenale]
MDSDELSDIQSRLYKMIPKQTQDIIATAIFLVALPVGFLINIFFVMPLWYPAFGEAWVIRVTGFLFLAFNVYMNWYKMLKVGPSGLSPELPNIGDEEREASLEGDSESIVTRVMRMLLLELITVLCVMSAAFAGIIIVPLERYFVAAVANLLVLMLPLFSYTWDFAWTRIEGGFSLGRSWQIFLPHLALLARVISLYQFCCIVFCASNFTEVHAYQLGLLDNLRQCLGSRPLPSDGMSFVTREIKELNDPKYL